MDVVHEKQEGDATNCDMEVFDPVYHAAIILDQGEANRNDGLQSLKEIEDAPQEQEVSGEDAHGASFVSDLGDGHVVRFLVSDFGISWVESRNGHELVKLEGAEAIQELQRMTEMLHQRRGADSTATQLSAPSAA